MLRVSFFDMKEVFVFWGEAIQFLSINEKTENIEMSNMTTMITWNLGACEAEPEQAGKGLTPVAVAQMTFDSDFRTNDFKFTS